jgi:hypothetical protein
VPAGVGTSGRPPPAGSKFYAGHKVKKPLLAQPLPVSRKNQPWKWAKQGRRKGRLRTGGLHRRFPAGLEWWQVLRVLNLAEVGEQRLLGMPGVLGQVPEQGHTNARIEVLLGEDPADQLLELKLHELARSCLARRGWLSRLSGVPLVVVSRGAEFGMRHHSVFFGMHCSAGRWTVRAGGAAAHLDVHGTTPLRLLWLAVLCHALMMNSLWTSGPPWVPTLRSGGPSKG